MLTEKFLHFVWKYGLFDHVQLETTQREKIEIVHPGFYNTDQGPDFKDARIRFENNLFAGHVELHLSNQEWYDHNHHRDEHYANCILHVVFNLTNDPYVKGPNDTVIPIICLKPYIAAEMMEKFSTWMMQHANIPCSNLFVWPEKIVVANFKNKLLAERLTRKCEEIKKMLQFNQEHWELTFYQHLAGSFGNRVNRDYFMTLAASIPLYLINKYKTDRFKLQALFFGQANLLNRADDFARALETEYQYLKTLHQLQPLQKSPYFLRMRPASFPTIRLAQFVALIHQSVHLYSKLMLGFHPKEIMPYFNVEIDPYWRIHYHFGKRFAKPIEGLPGEEMIRMIIINTIVPFVFLYDQTHHPDSERFILFLESLKPEDNYRIRKILQVLPVENQHAFDSQALIEWHQQYCEAKKCLDCVVGYHTLKASNNLKNHV